MVKLDPGKKNKQTKASSADCFQVRSLSEQRSVKKIGVVDADVLEKVKEGLAIALSIGY